MASGFCFPYFHAGLCVCNNGIGYGADCIVHGGLSFAKGCADEPGEEFKNRMSSEL